MILKEHEASTIVDPTARATGCPVAHGVGAWAHAPADEYQGPRLECDSQGVWQVRDFALARQILRGTVTKQAGFNAELIEQVPGTESVPILYQEGQTHHEQRRQTARFFAPKTVSTHYRELMDRLTARLLADFRRTGHADLSKMSMELAVAVAAEVVGLTDSAAPGLSRRLDAFFSGNSSSKGGRWRNVLRRVNQLNILQFFWLDVKPAIRARRQQPKEDVISHLLGKNYNDAEILTECITYAAAGMVTTREFITVATWYLLMHPDLREQYLAAPEAVRHDLLNEILRLEPVVGHLYRRATADIPLMTDAGAVTIPSGALLDLHIYQTNRDERVTGPAPESICPGRQLLDRQVNAAVLSFGDGHHRCPGSFIAIQESDIFLRQLLALPGLRLDAAPTVTWDDLTAGYELRGCLISNDPAAARRDAAERGQPTAPPAAA